MFQAKCFKWNDSKELSSKERGSMKDDSRKVVQESWFRYVGSERMTETADSRGCPEQPFPSGDIQPQRR
jgi:hypothetical protein